MVGFDSIEREEKRNKQQKRLLNTYIFFKLIISLYSLDLYI